MRLWDKAQELYENIDDLQPKQQKFIKKIIEYGDPHNLLEELSEKQIQWINWMYKKYVVGEEAEW